MLLQNTNRDYYNRDLYYLHISYHFTLVCFFVINVQDCDGVHFSMLKKYIFRLTKTSKSLLFFSPQSLTIILHNTIVTIQWTLTFSHSD